MPRVKASMADVSTEYEPIDPGTYEMEVESVEEETGDDDRVQYILKARVQDPDSEHHNKPVTDYIHIHKKDGTLNPYGLAQLKSYFEAIVGDERANADDADTDELVKGRFFAEVTIDSYEKKRPDGTSETRQVNRIKNPVAL